MVKLKIKFKEINLIAITKWKTYNVVSENKENYFVIADNGNEKAIGKNCSAIRDGRVVVIPCKKGNHYLFGEGG